MALTFVQADTFGEGWTLKARKGRLPVGRILRGPDGRYRFYKSSGGSGTSFLQSPLFENHDFANMKKWLNDQKLDIYPKESLLAG